MDHANINNAEGPQGMTSITHNPHPLPHRLTPHPTTLLPPTMPASEPTAAFAALLSLRILQTISLIPLFILTHHLYTSLLPSSPLLLPYVLSCTALIWATIGNCLYLVLCPLAATLADLVICCFFGGAAYQLSTYACNGALVLDGRRIEAAGCEMLRACFGLAVLQTVLFAVSAVVGRVLVARAE